jgi:hypothetical protein
VACSVAEAKHENATPPSYPLHATNSDTNTNTEKCSVVADKTQRCGKKNLSATLQATADKGYSVVADRTPESAEKFLSDDSEIF